MGMMLANRALAMHDALETDGPMEKNSSTQVSCVRPRRWSAPVCVAVIVAALVGGCGLVKTGYRNGDIVGLFMIDRYFDLSGEQEEFVKPRLHRLLVWHRTTQLPDYTAFAQDLQQKAMRPITPAEVDALGDDGRRRAMATIDQALPDMADLALVLTPDNLHRLEKKFAEDTDKWRREYMKGDHERQLQARYERTLDRVEEWYGRFDSDQRDRIRQLSDARPFNNEIVVGERERRQRELVALLTKVEREKPPRDAVVAMMKAYADRFEKNPDPEKRAFLESLRQSTEAMDAAIQNLSTLAQRKRAVAKLQDWIDDFRTLSTDRS
jgi:hypothetical protein